MRISSRCEYGLRAMVFLAGHQTGRPVPLTEIAGHEAIPAAFLERIMARLRDCGLVVTTRGAAGGYRVARDPQSISVADVVTAIEGPLSLVGCLPDSDGCERSESCASRRVWRRLDEAIGDALGTISLADLVRETVPT